MWVCCERTTVNNNQYCLAVASLLLSLWFGVMSEMWTTMWADSSDLSSSTSESYSQFGVMLKVWTTMKPAITDVMQFPWNHWIGKHEVLEYFGQLARDMFANVGHISPWGPGQFGFCLWNRICEISVNPLNVSNTDGLLVFEGDSATCNTFYKYWFVWQYNIY